LNIIYSNFSRYQSVFRRISKKVKEEKKILKLIIEDFVETALPISSRSLCKKHELALSPATVRNVMMDLEEKGHDLKRTLRVRKMRGTKHTMRKLPFEIQQDGIVIYYHGEQY